MRKDPLGRYKYFKRFTEAMSKSPTYTLTIRPLPDASDPGGIRRLRRALKALRRGYGLQCVRIEPAKEPNEVLKRLAIDVTPMTTLHDFA